MGFTECYYQIVAQHIQLNFQLSNLPCTGSSSSSCIFAAPASNMSQQMLIPSENDRLIIDKMADYVVRNGSGLSCKFLHSGSLPSVLFRRVSGDHDGASKGQSKVPVHVARL